MLALVVVLIVVGVALAVRAGQQAGGSTPSAASLCDVQRTAASGDFTSAEVQFMDRAHEPLHELARALGVSDRTNAARLLEAKQLVEAAIERRQLDAGSFDELVEATDDGLQALGRPGLECATRG